MPVLSTRCPYCFGKMKIQGLRCSACGTEVASEFSLSALTDLSIEQQEFIIQFVIASGSLKEMARILGVSYPTVRARLDRIIEALKGKKSAEDDRRAAILDALEEKRISPQEAAKLLK